MNKYEIHFKYNEDYEKPAGYSIFFESELCADTSDEIIALAIKQHKLDEDDLVDLDYIDYAIRCI